jgi:hypothetical protein
MAYLDNKTITIQAILTNKGRQLLAQNGTLNITSFALADDEINYNLYQPNHPLGSAYYDLAIRNTPILEPFSDETQALKHKLVTLSAGATSVPIVSVSQTSLVLDKNYSAQIIIAPSTNPTYDTTLGYTAILVNKNVGSLTVTQTNSLNSTSATIPTFYGSAITEASQVVIGSQFQFIPNTSLVTTTSTQIIIIGNESGGSVTIPVTVTVSTTTT